MHGVARRGGARTRAEQGQAAHRRHVDALPLVVVRRPVHRLPREGALGAGLHTSRQGTWARGLTTRVAAWTAPPPKQAARGTRTVRVASGRPHAARLACRATCRWKSESGAAAAMRSSTVSGVMSWPDWLTLRGAPGWLGCQPAPSPPACDLLPELPMPCEGEDGAWRRG